MSEDAFGEPAPPYTPQTYAAAPEPYSAQPGSTPGSVPGPGPSAAGPWPVPPVESGSSHATSVRRRKRWLWWAAGSLVATSLVGLCAYLAVVSHQWSTRVDDLTAVSHELGTEVSEQTAARKAAQAEATALQVQLDTAKARITTLADEEANATDREAVWIDLVDAVISCADERQVVIDAYINSRRFQGISNAGYAAEITEYCEGLKSDYADYKAEIGK